jgi:hypothetical protein
MDGAGSVAEELTGDGGRVDHRSHVRHVGELGVTEMLIRHCCLLFVDNLDSSRFLDVIKPSMFLDHSR